LHLLLHVYCPKCAAQSINLFSNFLNISNVLMLGKMTNNFLRCGKYLLGKILNINLTFHDAHVVWFRQSH